ncbi:hypothetical protein BMF94_6967 [Rhodotorula taiwanensis]|uniref:Uncharacterized protein n=1 Tax=Rhodotorula taiwanensis TaxID=741276 RepID=A0A2S5AZS0_9BASI|nr:hypothetical protein BMF94_6967 [Rhodotorula taiwanensis]
MLFENIFLPLALLAAAALGTPVATSTDLSGPTPPQLKWLYTAYALCPADLLNGALTPAGIRKEIPIVGGNFTGPGINGKFRSQGADWGTVDPRTGIFSADTRYNGVTDDGADVYFQTSGPMTPEGTLHLRIRLETGSPKYYYLNNVLAVGVLHILGQDSKNVSTLRIDAFNFENDWPNTTFLNNTGW